MLLTKIKAIKARKLTLAQQALQRAQAKILAKRREVQQAEQALENYVEWRLAEEDRLFERAHEQCLNRQGLDGLRHEVGLLRAGDARLNQKILDAQHQVDLAIEEKNLCQQNLIRAEKVLEKYHSLLAQEAEKQKRERERLEEYSLDEFVSARYTGARP